MSRKNQQPERTEPWVEAAVPATAQSLHWRRARATHSCVTAPTGTPRDPSDSSSNTGMYYQSLDPLQHHGTQGSRASLLAQQQGHQVPLTAWTPCCGPHSHGQCWASHVPGTGRQGDRLAREEAADPDRATAASSSGEGNCSAWAGSGCVPSASRVH